MSIEDPNTGPGQQPGTRSPDLQAQASNDLSQAKEHAKHDLDQAKEHAKHDLDSIKHRAEDDVRKLGEQANEKMGEAKGKAKSFASDQKDLAAEQINGVAQAINKVADELDGSEQQTIARYARDIASGLSRMGDTVEQRDVDDLMGLAQDFGRKQPVAFLGAAALAGFVASRFALASAHRRDTKSGPTSTVGDTQPQTYSPASSTVYRPGEPGQNRTGGL